MFGSKPDAPSGMETMLRTMGLGEVLDAAKTLASSGAIQKILGFADQLEGMNVVEINQRLERIERLLNVSYIEHRGDDGSEGLPALTGGLRTASDEPASNGRDV